MTPTRMQALLAAALAITLAACGGPDDSGVDDAGLDEQAARKNSVEISVSPATVSLPTGGTQQFSASVSGSSNTDVTWTIQEGAAGGAVSSTGLYTAPSTAGTYRVVATSQADPWRSAVATVTVTAALGAPAPTVSPAPTDAAAVTLYADGLSSGWGDWSWAPRNLANAAPVHSGSRSIAVTYGPWQGLYFSHGGVSTSGLSYLELSAHGGTTAGAALGAYVVVGGVQRTKVSVAPYCSGGTIPANAWTRCRVPLSALGATNATVTGVVVQEFAGRSLPTMYVDAVALTGEAGTGTTSPTTTQPVAPAPSAPAVVAPAPTPIAISVSPQSTSLAAGGSQQFTASVSGTTNTSVVWTIQEGSVAGSISSTGLFTASSAPGTYRVVATSQVDPTKSAVAQVTVGAASVSSGIPPERTTTWRPGIPGGVPSRTTVCATISAATYGNGSTDATAAIQNAINSCPLNQVVYLPAGTYKISNTINLNRSVVLRGAGANSTTLLRSPAGRGVQMGNWTSRGTGVNLTANAQKGATSITVADASPFLVGDIVSIDQLDDPAVVQGTTCIWMKRGSAGAWRSIGQMVEITGKSGNTLTLASPLHWTFTTALRAQLVPLSPRPTRYAGLEDLRISGASAHGVNVLYAAYSWIKGVETDRVDGIHVTLDGTYRFILRDSYAHHSIRYAYGGSSYGYSLESQASDNLIENNIVHYLGKPIQFRNSGGGNVVAYNYVDDSWSQPDSSGNIYFQELSIDSHCAFSHMELVEGNYAPHMGVAATWGNAAAITYFRNQATSVFRTLKPTMNQSAIQLDARTFDMNVVGNVLGAPGLAGTTFQSFDSSNCRTTAPFIYRFNYDSATGYCTFPSPVDYRASNTVLRHGNFDHATNAVQWSPTISSRTLPASLYLTSKPAFFGSSPWPWVDPAGTNRVSTLPAKARFDAGRPNG